MPPHGMFQAAQVMSLDSGSMCAATCEACLKLMEFTGYLLPLMCSTSMTQPFPPRDAFFLNISPTWDEMILDGFLFILPARVRARGNVHR